MFSRNKSKSVGGSRLDRFVDSIAAQEQSWKKAKPFFPSLTKFLLIIGLGFLSWLATYTGMLELIQANSGYLDFSYKLAIAFAVAMLMLMIIYILDALFSPLRWWLRLMYVMGYVFLTLISVGFGFGFYWKFLESRAEATRSAESAVSQVQTALQTGQTRLEQLQTTLASLTTLSAQKAVQESTKGRTCPNSPPGDGPRRRLRDADSDSFRFAGDFVSQRVGTVKSDIASLNADMAKVVTGAKSTFDPKTGTRNAFLRGLNGRLDLTIARFNAFRTDPQLRQFRDTFAKRSEQTVFDDGRGGKFRCPDPQLQLALRGVVKAIDGLPQLENPAISAVEGSEAIVEAFRRMTTSTIGLLTLKLPPTPDELRALQRKAVQSVRNVSDSNPVLQQRPGLGERDYIPLFVAIFVDLCILLVSVNRPVNRLQGFINAARDARDAEMHEVLDRFHQVHKGERSQRLDIFHDAMFDWNGDQYVAVPLDLRSVGEGEEHKKKVIQARYLSTLLATLEETGLVKRTIIIRTNVARRKLTELCSPFADSPGFRVYRFTKGAWPAIVLDDVLGASDKLIAEQTAAAHRLAVHDLFSPLSTRPEPNFSNLGRPEFPSSVPGETGVSSDRTNYSSIVPKEEWVVPPKPGIRVEPDVQMHDFDAVPSDNGASDRASAGAIKGEQRAHTTNGSNGAGAHPPVPPVPEDNLDGDFAGNGSAAHPRSLMSVKTAAAEGDAAEVIDDDQQPLPLDDSEPSFAESQSDSVIILGDATSRTAKEEVALDAVAGVKSPAKTGLDSGEMGPDILDQEIVHDLTEAMAIEAAPVKIVRAHTTEPLTISGSAQTQIPEPPNAPQSRRLPAASKGEQAAPERIENIPPHRVEILPRSGEHSASSKASPRAKPQAPREKILHGWKESPNKAQEIEDLEMDWRQPKIDIEKIARHFSPKRPTNGKSRG